MPTRYLLKHVGNMGDMVFFIPPLLATLKRREPDCHITFITAWGFRDKKGRWGKRNLSGFCLHLAMTNPHIDQLVHWHDTKLALDSSMCEEDGQRFPTWNPEYFAQQRNSGAYDVVVELDFGLAMADNPIQRMYKALHVSDETYTKYELHFSPNDLAIAAEVMSSLPHPRIVLLEGLAGQTTRGWDPGKVPHLERAIERVYGVEPIWFGAQHIPDYWGKPLSLRQNIATLTFCDAAIGVLSGPLHFAAAAGLPTLTLYCDNPLHRAAPAYFLNEYVTDAHKLHRTLLGPSGSEYRLLKNDGPSINLTPGEAETQGTVNWNSPGRQATKTCMSVITVEEIMNVLSDMVPIPQ